MTVEVTKEERRRLEARRKRQRVRIAKGSVISMLAIAVPALIYLATQV